MEYLYDKQVIGNNLNGKDKHHIHIALHTYNNILMNYHNAMGRITHNLTISKNMKK